MRLAEEKIIGKFRINQDNLWPLVITRLEKEFATGPLRPDMIVDFSLESLEKTGRLKQKGISFTAMIEVKTVATPQNILFARQQLLNYRLSQTRLENAVLMILCPYMPPKQIRILAEAGISWIDLSGNMVITAPPNIYIEKTGRPNQYRDTAPIKKIFEGVSSLVSRALLIKPDGFSSQNEMVDFINKRNANITLSTVSKVLKSLEENLLIDKTENLITARDKKTLLQNLADGYKAAIKRREKRIYKYAVNDIDRMFQAFFNYAVKYVINGMYAANLKGLAVSNEVTIYVKDIEEVKKALQNIMPFKPDSEFGNVIVAETDDPGIWFNADIRPLQTIVDDIELYLELCMDKPRGPVIAEKLKSRILGE